MKTLIKIRFLWLIMFSMLLYTTSNAIAVDWTNLIGPSPEMFNADSREERIEIAKSIKGQIEKLDSYLPSVKPSEKEWIEKEEFAIGKINDLKAFEERSKHLHESPEYLQLRLKELIDRIKNGLECIANEKVKLRDEMLCWAVVSHQLSDTDLFNAAIMTLKRYGRLPEDIAQKANLTSENLGYGEKYDWIGRGILEFIIISYLANK